MSIRGILLAVACGVTLVPSSRRGAAAQQGDASSRATGASGTSAPISPLDPCALLTKAEIQQQVELSLSSGKADKLRNQGAAWSIMMQPAPRGVSPTCQVAWLATVKDEVYSRGTFSIVVTSAGWLTGSIAGMTHPLPISNLGDEAYFVGGKSGPPYARVGDVAIGIENFPDTKQARSGLDLLRSAVHRARAQRGTDK